MQNIVRKDVVMLLKGGRLIDWLKKGFRLCFCLGSLCIEQICVSVVCASRGDLHGRWMASYLGT